MTFHTFMWMIFLTTLECGICRRPLYIIGHAANTEADVIPYLEDGANVLESDMTLFPNGSVKQVYHGCRAFHDCFVNCGKHTELPRYLSYLRNITDPSRKDSYYGKLIAQMFDMKLDTSHDLRETGRDIARHILDYLWSDGDRPQEIKAVIYIYHVNQKDAIVGFLEEFKNRGQESRLQDVGFDGGSGNITALGELFKELKVTNVWIGDGILNCIDPVYPTTRLKEALEVRNTGGFIKKVYAWTVDLKFDMRRDLNLNVDGFITNRPAQLIQVINEDQFKDRYRPATFDDPIFERYEG